MTSHLSRYLIFFLIPLVYLPLLTACRSDEAESQLPPTRIPVAVPPTLAPTPTPLQITLTDEITPVATSIPLPTPRFVSDSDGLRPAQAPLYRALDPFSPFEEASTADYLRPPPYDVPLSLHPDDHYWLIRPIPSGYRNFDLEWFPYGNDVLIEELAPYRIHHGLDFPNDTGTPILAASSGTVIWAGPLPSARDGVNYYGNTVIIEHDWEWQGQPVFTLYAHTLELFVTVGDYVDQGQLIAGVGASGAVSGAHLHLEVRVGRNNRFASRNPALWIAPYSGWGTLAGSFTDQRGRYITNATISIRPVGATRPLRTRRTYAYDLVTPDEVWGENFVIPDLPAGRYDITIQSNGRAYDRTIDILPGRTNFIAIEADFFFTPPTATPPPPEAPPATATPSPES
ncbi:MAG TPA: peptidoglycan DD-metalloendopeptidase family protein [Anaerolineae bacterium]|nr:peptidoglycan DD-metalloendopeptidase family protein [Anaerolineae bacterium]